MARDITEKLRPAGAVYLLAVLTIIAIGMLVVLLLLNMRARDLQQARQETASLARMLTDQTEQSFRSVDLALRGVQDRLQTPFGEQLGLDSLPVQLLLATKSDGLRQVRALLVVDTDGAIRNASNRPSAADVLPGFEELRKFADRAQPGALFIGHPLREPQGGAWILYMARRIHGPDGAIRGMLVASVDLGHFEQFYGYMEQDSSWPIGLYLSDGTLVASLPHRQGDIGKPARELRLAGRGVSDGSVKMFEGVDEGHSRHVFALGNVANFPLRVSVTDNDARSLAAWRETAIPLVLGAALVCLFIAIAAVLLANELRRESALSSALREADHRYRLTIDSVMDAIVSIDATQTIVMFNSSAERMFGVPATEAIGMPLDRLLPLRHRQAHAGHIRAFMNANVASREMALQMEIHGLRSDGAEFPLESAISKTLIDGKPQLTAVLRDVTERHRKDAQLREINSELRRLSAALQSVREEERKRISLELHDDLGQQLAGLKLELTWFGERLREGRRVASDMLDAMHAMLDRAIHSVRHISTELRPWILDELDLGSALAWQMEEATRRTNIRYECHLPAACLIRDDALATAIFRIVQEALSNVVRHAHAQSVAVHLLREQDELVLTVRDSGRGFAHDPGGRGIGLVGMRERATALGGTFSVTSEAGQGTTIEVHVPLAAQVAALEEA